MSPLLLRLLLALASAPAASAEAEGPKAPRSDLKLSVDAQMRGGYTQSPFITGPDAAPLASLGGAANSGPAATFSTVITPGLSLELNRRRLKFTVGYQPRIFYDVLAAAPASIFHGVNLNLVQGTDASWLLTVGTNVSVGGLDFGQAGLALNQFAGSPAAGGSAALDFFSATGFLRLARPLNKRWKVTATQTATKIGTPPSGGASFLAGASVSTIPALQSQNRLDSDWLLAYRSSPRHATALQLLGTLVQYPATGTYLSLWPSLNHEGQVSRTDKWRARLGVFKFWTNPFVGIYLKPDYLITGSLTWEHTFAAINLPHLVLALELTEQPYYDIIYGTIAPRATFGATLNNNFSRKFSGRVQLRDYSQAYFTGRRWRDIPKQRDKNVLVVSTEVSYQYVRWLAFTGGLYYLNRWIQPSATVPYTQLRDMYAYVGVRGAYDLK